MGGKPRAHLTNRSLPAQLERRVAFLRGMNLGRRRITNVELCQSFGSMGFTNVTAFLASGNVIFDLAGAGGGLEARIEEGLATRLGYDVPTFVRSADQVREIAGSAPFDPEQLAATAGRVQVMLLRSQPSPHVQQVVEALATASDRLAFEGAQLYWLPRGGLSDSDLDLGAIGAAVGPMTIRTKRTLERIAARFLSGAQER